jgi:amino acid adenylation domain-containing protein
VSVDELLGSFEKQGIELWFEGDRLRFRAPKGALSPDLRARLSASKAEVVARLRAAAATRSSTSPLSYSQRSLWFVNQEDLASAAYNVSFSSRIISALDVPALQQALQALVDRHASLRTTFPIEHGLPVQRVAGAAPAVLELHDAAGWSEATLLDRVTADYRRPFDLVTGPVFRTSLFSRAPDDHVLVLAVHHIAADGWSTLRLVEELRAFYAEATGGPVAMVARPTIEYTDYSHWQAQTLAGPEGERLAQYWTRQLAAPRTVLELPTDRRRPPTRSSRGATLAFELDLELSTHLRQLARDQNSTLFVLLLAAYKVLLFRYTGAGDVIVGTPTFGRNRPEFANVIGDFVNTLPLRSSLDADMPFTELLAQIKQTLLAALDAQEFPLSLMVERLQPVRDASRSPLFEILFVLQRFEQLEGLKPVLSSESADAFIEFAGLRLKNYAIDQQEGQFDLTLQIVDGAGALEGHFKYNAELFDRSTIERMSTHFHMLLRGVVDAPAGAIGRLPLLAPRERAALLGDAQAALPSSTDAKTLHERFESQVRLAPNAVALSCEGKQLSYGELNRRANRLAHCLRAQGITSQTLVALCAERSLDLVVGLIGILKAGGAYLPIDLSYPAERVAFMLEDAQATMLVTQRALLDKLPIGGMITVLLDDDLAFPDTDPAPTAGPDDVIYVIYTSGSTGKPKGTVLTHRAVDRLFTSTQPWYRFGASDVWTLFHSIAFDFSVWELWGALVHGGRLVVVPQVLSRSPDAFLELLRDEGVTVLNQTPSAFRQLMQIDAAGAKEPLTQLRHVIFGGEPLELQSLRPWFARYGDARPMLINMYGITETCVHVTYRPIRLADVDAGRGSVIGIPIPDLRVVLLDSAMEPVPQGVPGEMYVGGPGLARGYLRRDELSRTRFVDDPFRPGERLYRSGDLARRRADGELEYLGRMDQQVKLRGFRIELGEIEAVLARHPAVRDVVVDTFEANDGDTRLVAYVVLQTGARLSRADMREYLIRDLPDYMVPSHVAAMQSLPLTANGKVDRRALPVPRADVDPIERQYNPPQTPSEAALAEIWCRTLDVPGVGRNDDFFALGGHSLLATQVASRLREVFQLDLPVRVLFEASTLAGLAARIDDALARHRQAMPLPPITPTGTDGPARLSFSQERMWLIQTLAPENLAYNLPAALRFQGNLDVAALSDALDAVRLRHEALRTTFRMVDGQPMQEVSIWRSEPLAIVDVRTSGDGAQEEALRLARAEACIPFDLAAGPVMRCVLYRIGDQDHLLLMTLHHIACDQWSFGLLGRELGVLYNERRAQRQAALPGLPIRYRDFAVWQREWMQGAELDRQMAYWVPHLADSPALELPTDRPRPIVQSFHGRWLSVQLPQGLMERVEDAARREGATLFMLAYAAFATLLHRLSGQQDIAVGVPIANRNRSAIEGLVGTFVNTLVMRTDLTGAPSFRELLHRVRGVALDAYAHQDVPFEQLVERVGRRDAGRAPLVQVLFNVQNAPMQGIRFDDLQWQTVPVDRGAAQFELSVMIDTEINRSLIVEYNTDLFDGSTVQRMVAQYFELLEGALADPQAKLAALPLLPPAQQRQLREWNQASNATYPTDVVYAQLFAEQVQACPQAIAVSVSGMQLSYGELNGRANRLAWHLRSLGVGAGVLVGVCLDRSIDLCMALLAVHKAGGAYVPLDPGFPPDRLGFMLEDSGAAVLVTMGDSLPDVDLPRGLHVVDLVAQSALLPAASTADLDVACGPRDPAYVIYTSGSTGRPKGVVVPHGALVNFLLSMREAPGLRKDDVLAAVTTISFDIAGLELYLPWLVGARVELVDRETAVDGVALSALLRGAGATLLQATPATWRLLIEADWRPAPGFRALCGGEALPRDLAQALLERVDELWNLYGPTETTIWSTLERVQRSAPLITVGRPIANTQIYVVDTQGRHVPVGIPGEIWIGGAGVALGYHGRPDLTADRFVPDTFIGGPDATLYRTGDLGRLLPDGRLEHLGRLDHQVKIRGFRIELGEIETVLGTHDAVRQCVVVAREAAPGDLRLVAYVAYQPGEDLTVSEVRRHLRKELPDYMIPSVVVALEAVPLTPNGKVDRKALPDPFKGVLQPAADYQPPAQGTEHQLAKIWREVLKVERVGAEDNFFELGGHSLLSLRVAAAVQKTFGWRMDPRTMFFQNLRQIAAGFPNLTSARGEDHSST